MALPTADAAAAKWASGMQSSTTRITTGIQGVTVAPGQAAARQKAVWAQNVAASVDKWAGRVSSVDLATWQNDAITKGVPRIGPGAAAAQPKFQAFMSQLLAYEQSQLGSLPARGNLDQNIARMTQWARQMSQFKRR